MISVELKTEYRGPVKKSAGRSLSATVKSKERYPDTHGNWNYFKLSNRDEHKLKALAMMPPKISTRAKAFSVLPLIFEVTLSLNDWR